MDTDKTKCSYCGNKLTPEEIEYPEERADCGPIWLNGRHSKP